MGAGSGEEGLPQLVLGRMGATAVGDVYARGRRIAQGGRPTGADLDALETGLRDRARRARPDDGMVRPPDRAEMASAAAMRQERLARLPGGGN